MKLKTSLPIAIVLGLGIAGLTWFINHPFADPNSGMNNINDEITLPKTESIEIGNGIDMEFVLIRSGSFTMGSSLHAGDGDEAPEHKVTITKPFYLGKYEVTQEQWEDIMGYNPSQFKGDRRPVDSVSWEEAQIFLKKLQDKTGQKFGLPTEAQWEYAARAGTRTTWDFGDSESILGDYAWFGENSGDETHPVGQKKPNAWGLFDMYGNVQEWCNDWYANPYPEGDVSDPQGPGSGDSRVLRGGAWGDDFTMVRSAYRNASGADAKTPGIGLRVVMIIE
ncbi:formylglycine-generating enzyme family protein [Paenibacillus sp.]|uniref:formylglycine-generating enzyme family protein n=1 Tax=Paenibacillus sp. TaxID=58172 RepID=UPI002D6B1330|nr:formylglycine-generating enzyme family protein [Paenibacillus sp.]HZG83995.1 formylglycine-generating enzyme family protein [Paenibacillus sp.]